MWHDGTVTAVPSLTVDALGRKCPLPVIMLAQRIGEVPIGGVLAVLADDPAARADVPSWCRLKSHDFVEARPLPGGSAGPGGWELLVRRCY